MPCRVNNTVWAKTELLWPREVLAEARERETFEDKKHRASSRKQKEGQWKGRKEGRQTTKTGQSMNELRHSI